MSERGSGHTEYAHTHLSLTMIMMGFILSSCSCGEGSGCCSCSGVPLGSEELPGKLDDAANVDCSVGMEGNVGVCV